MAKHLFNRLFAALLALNLALAPALANDLGNSTFSETDASNNAASPNGWTSGQMLPSQVEPTARALAGALKRFYDQINSTIVSGGSANVQTLTYSVAPAQYYTGQCFNFFVSFTNTGATTLNVNGLGAKSIFSAGAALSGGELINGSLALVCYDSTQFQLLATSAEKPITRTAWTVYTVTASCASGSASTNTATGYYTRIGNTIIANINFTLGVPSSCAPSYTLPTSTHATHGSYNCTGQIAAVGGLIAAVAQNTNLVLVFKYDNSTLTSAGSFAGTMTCIYESA